MKTTDVNNLDISTQLFVTLGLKHEYKIKNREQDFFQLLIFSRISCSYALALTIMTRIIYIAILFALGIFCQMK